MNKCSLPEHSKIDPIIFCQECRIFMCNQCYKIHQEICRNHHQYKLDNNIKDIFTGFCLEKNHTELKYYCKTHNKLCCAECITKIKDEENGQHSDCDICIIKEIENEKRIKLNENLQKLENILNNYQELIKELKIKFEKINESKEKLKLKIQEIFTKIRNIINDREDKLILEVDSYFDNRFNENIIKESIKLPKKIKESIEKGKLINNEWKNKKLNISINDYIKLENNIIKINDDYQKINKYKSMNLVINFYENDIIKCIIEEINNKFYTIKYYSNNFKFKKSPLNISEDRKYEVSGEYQNILTKTGIDNKCMGSICENELNKFIEENIWIIRILKTKNYAIMVGVATIDFDINSASYESDKNYGWYYQCFDGTLYSGPPHNYRAEKTNLKKQKDEIKMIMNMRKGTLKFIIDNEDKGESFTDIPLDKPIAPSVLLYNINDSVEIYTDF